ncbi:MAG: cytochrome c oxidase subunit 3 [Gemmataceae bacterium]|nr:cytochrome c oxidase subunit 3 [Gemmataceae bacterium]
MGLPLPHGKLAMWLFLVTEIMFFTGLIGTYVLLRNGQPGGREPWPSPEDVHLIEWVGAFNTFVLICSSLTVVLAHYVLGKGNVKLATQLVGVTLALGGVFLVVKAFEYHSKFSHGILPGRVHEKLDGPGGPRYLRQVEKELRHIVEHPEQAAGVSALSANKWAEFLKDTAEPARAKALKEKEAIDAQVKDKKLTDSAAEQQKQAIDNNLAKELEEKTTKLVDERSDLKAVAAAWDLLERLPTLGARQVNLEIAGSRYVESKPALKVDGDPGNIKGLIHEYPNLHLSYAIPFGNMWASCYFAMTGVHALHVLGGLVIFVIILLMARRGQFGPQHEPLLEYTGLYWHFVDIVWIFLFPLLYLV